MGFMIHLISIKSPPLPPRQDTVDAPHACTFVQNRFVSVRGRNFIFTGAGLGKNDHLAFGIWHSGTTQV